VHHYLFKQESNTSESLKKLGDVLTCYLKNPASSITSAVNKNKCIIISSEKIKSAIIIFSAKSQAPHYSLDRFNFWDGTDGLGPQLIANSSSLQRLSAQTIRTS